HGDAGPAVAHAPAQVATRPGTAARGDSSQHPALPSFRGRQPCRGGGGYSGLPRRDPGNRNGRQGDWDSPHHRLGRRRARVAHAREVVPAVGRLLDASVREFMGAWREMLDFLHTTRSWVDVLPMPTASFDLRLEEDGADAAEAAPDQPQARLGPATPSMPEE